jgi:hypothetical protein
VALSGGGSVGPGNFIAFFNLGSDTISGSDTMGSHRSFVLRRGLALVVLGGILAAGAGCNVIGLAAHLAPSPTVKPAYHGLVKRKVAVMVWTDRAMAIDWPTLQLDLARGIDSRLEAAAKEKDVPKDLEGTSFAMPESVIRFQRDHPETETQAITDVAPRMDISRLIYVEVEHFSTQPGDSNDLLRGQIVANLKVIEIADGKGKIGFQMDNIRILYPEKGNPEGMPGLSPTTVYEKTVESFATEVAHQFVPYTAPDK